MSQSCGCKIEAVMLDEKDGMVGGCITGKKISYCPLHAAAPELLEALKQISKLVDFPVTKGTNVGNLVNLKAAKKLATQVMSHAEGDQK